MPHPNLHDPLWDARIDQPLAVSVAQVVEVQLLGACCILELDDVIADWRQEARLPRIGTK
ncbi:MAG TPA: hypothetical protein VKD28_13440 [Gemmatimonadales bacterium]|nr:hypothetical protein [Gemmatimonadales bacterium]